MSKPVKKKDIVALFLTMNGLGSMPGGKFGYGISKNMKLIEDEIESLKGMETMSEEFKEYDQKRVEIVKKYAKKDEKGDFVMKSANEYDVPDDKKRDLDSDIKKLQKEYKGAIDGRVKQIEDYTKVLEEEYVNAFFPYKIKFEDVPPQLNVQQIHALQLLLSEPEPPKEK